MRSGDAGAAGHGPGLRPGDGADRRTAPGRAGGALPDSNALAKNCLEEWLGARLGEAGDARHERVADWPPMAVGGHSHLPVSDFNQRRQPSSSNSSSPNGPRRVDGRSASR